VSAPDCVTSQPLGTPYNKNDFADIEPSEPLKQDS
jgi:hypothetical protein